MGSLREMTQPTIRSRVVLSCCRSCRQWLLGVEAEAEQQRPSRKVSSTRATACSASRPPFLSRALPNSLIRSSTCQDTSST